MRDGVRRAGGGGSNMCMYMVCTVVLLIVVGVLLGMVTKHHPKLKREVRHFPNAARTPHESRTRTMAYTTCTIHGYPMLSKDIIDRSRDAEITAALPAVMRVLRDNLEAKTKFHADVWNEWESYHRFSATVSYHSGRCFPMTTFAPVAGTITWHLAYLGTMGTCDLVRSDVAPRPRQQPVESNMYDDYDEWCRTHGAAARQLRRTQRSRAAM